MTYAFTQDLPINEDLYKKIREGLGDVSPKGLLSHVVVQLEQGIRYIDVWAAEEDYLSFTDTYVHPLLHRLFASQGREVPPEPVRTEIKVIDVFTGNDS